MLRARGADDSAPSYQGVDLQLPDGQLLQTNLANLAGLPVTNAISGPPEDKAVKAAPKTK